MPWMMVAGTYRMQRAGWQEGSEEEGLGPCGSEGTQGRQLFQEN